MGIERSNRMRRRQWRLAQALQEAGRQGKRASALVRELGVSRPTLYRDLKILGDGGVPIEKRHVNGEVRYGLFASPLPALAPSALELAALRLARSVLSGLEGMAFVTELDRMLERWSGKSDRPPALSLARRETTASPDVVKILDQTITRRRRVRFSYRGLARAQIAWRSVDPAALRWVDNQLYLVGWDIDRHAYRTFKVMRMRDVRAGPEPIDSHPDFDEQALFGRSVKVWSGDVADAAIRLSRDVAWLADEWPLIPEQQVEQQSDGSVIVRARVAGIVETMRWVLRWGAAAEALEPQELRDRVRGELADALSGYQRVSDTSQDRLSGPTLARARPNEVPESLAEPSTADGRKR